MSNSISTPNVFTDFHHASLLQSFILLFEKRLGGKVYRPIGLEWAEKGYWAVFDHPFTREQFLSTKLGLVEPPPQMYPDGTRPLNIVDHVEDGIYYCQDIDSGYFNKAITLDKFLSMHFDIVIASLPQHIKPFQKLCELHPDHPKLIYQIGNAWPVEAGLAKNIMASAIIENVPPEINFITYHQEFDLNIFNPKPISENKIITSFVNCFGVEKYFMNDYELFLKLEKDMSDWVFRAYGGQCRDGAAHGSKMLSEKITDTRFIFHTKWGGDGYGHILHNAFACARPLIIKKEYYKGKLGEKLLEDGVTCIAIDHLSIPEIIAKINYFNQPDIYTELCSKVYSKFKEVVSFDKEAQEIEVFLSKLI